MAPRGQRSRDARASRWPIVVGVAAVTALGAALRFVDLGAQGFWYDEAYSAYLVGLPPMEMFRLLPETESTPPLYYAVAWVWGRAFGTGEVGLRSLSALAGTAVVPIAFLLGRRLVSVRVGLVAALLAACSPLLVWYSQEARAYALLVLLTAVGLLAFVEALVRPDRWRLLGWTAASGLALGVHYLALVAVAPQAVWLLVVHRSRRGAWAATAALAALGGGLLPLALAQRATMHTAWIGQIPLGRRLHQLGSQFLSGFDGSPVLAGLAGAGLGTGLLLLLRGSRGERRAALAAGALGGSALLLALAMAVLGADELLTRNVIAAWPPLALTVAIGLGGRRSRLAGAVATLAVCAAWIGTTIAIDTHPGLQRPDWRKVSRALGPPGSARLVVLEHYRPKIPLFLYRRDLVQLARLDTVAVREVDVVAPDTPGGRSCWWGAACNLSKAHEPRAPRGFAVQVEVELPNFDLFRLRAPRAERLQVRHLRRELRHVGVGAMLLERAASRAIPNPRAGKAAARSAALV